MQYSSIIVKLWEDSNPRGLHFTLGQFFFNDSLTVRWKDQTFPPLQLYTVAQQLVQSNSNICLFLRDPSSSVKQSLRSLAALAVLAECKPRLWMEKRAAFLSPGSGCLLLPTQNDFLNTPKEKALSITGILCLSNPASQSHSTNPTFLCSGYC